MNATARPSIFKRIARFPGAVASLFASAVIYAVWAGATGLGNGEHALAVIGLTAFLVINISRHAMVLQNGVAPESAVAKEVAAMARKAGIAAPHVEVIGMEGPQAYAFWDVAGRPGIVLTSDVAAGGLLRPALAHELGHIVRNHRRHSGMTLFYRAVTVSLLICVVISLLKAGMGATTVMVAVTAGALLSCLKVGINTVRHRAEYEADEVAVRLVGKHEVSGMLKALSGTAEVPDYGRTALLLSSHPSLHDRISAVSKLT